MPRVEFTETSDCEVETIAIRISHCPVTEQDVQACGDLDNKEIKLIGPMSPN